MKSLDHYWYTSSIITWLLLPLSWLYCLIAVIRRKLYRSNFLNSYSSSVPVIVIGNIVVGGSGKTPLLLSLCEYIQKKGFKPGVVSRGYGGSVNGVKQVRQADLADVVGDEPLMIFQRTKLPVVVGADRVAAVDYLLNNNECDIVLSDDGMQHYRMQRELEIAVIDADRGFGNGFCLPAGPLRERVSRLQQVDIIVYNGISSDLSDKCSYSLQIVRLTKLNGEESRTLESFTQKPVHAVAGIGNPQRFFRQLRQNGIEIIEHAFPDHHTYRQDDFSEWSEACIIMTEKDAVKCGQLTLTDAWVAKAEAEFSGALESSLSASLLPLLSRHTNQ
jgi:tetraacyldisaccharide 4'-kinase